MERYVVLALSVLSGLFVGVPVGFLMGSTPLVRVLLGGAAASVVAAILYFGFRAALGAGEPTG